MCKDKMIFHAKINIMINNFSFQSPFYRDFEVISIFQILSERIAIILEKQFLVDIQPRNLNNYSIFSITSKRSTYNWYF